MTALPRPLPSELAELIAARMRVIGDPVRLRLLDALRDGERSVQELTDELGAGQQNVSKHLGVLHGAGIVTRRKVGTSVRYAVADPAVFQLCEQVCGSLQAQLAELTQLVGASAGG